MLNMHIDDVKTFVTVVDAGSISTAARDLHLTQPAVSRRVKRFEEAIGASLIDRRRRPLALTEPGQLAVERCRRFLAAIDDLNQLARSGGALTQEIRIGIAHALTELAVSDPIERTRAAFPHASIRLLTGWSHDLLARVKGGALHAAVILLFEHEGTPRSVNAYRLASEELLVVCSKSWRRRPGRAEDLQDVDWILNPDGCAARAELRAALNRLQIPLRVSIETYDYELQLQLIARTRAFGLVPSRLLQRSASRSALRVVSIKELQFQLAVWMLNGDVSSPIEMLLERFRRSVADAL
jgi:DNA-binding transcriptional LysR family regulator